MTAGRFREVDLDLLADYVGGALAGTPDETTVARLVADDDAWSRAYAELAPAVALVGADLAAWGEPVEAMPAGVADRLTAALAGAGPAAPVVPAQPDGGRQLTMVGAAGRRTGTSRARRRWFRRAGPVLVAAAAVAATGFGVTQFVTSAQDGGITAGGAQRENTDTDTAASASGNFRLATEPTRTDKRYTPDDLARTSGEPGVFSRSASPHGPGGVEGSDPRRSAPAAAADLDRFSERAALDACLGEVSAAHGAGPITVDRLEYAAFQGEAALVIGLVDATGARWVVVAGPECGIPGSGADSRHRTRVG